MTSHRLSVTAAADRVIDSLLVRDGRARAVDRHRTRFQRTLEEAFPDATIILTEQSHSQSDDATSADLSTTSLGLAWDRLLAEVPGQGSWFPLVEARRGTEDERVELGVELRPAPPLRQQTRLVTMRDRRRYPRWKGADPVITAEDRHTAVTHGADDALYLSNTGRITEAANGAVVGWYGHELLVVSGAEVLESTTLGLLVEEAESGRAGVPFTEVRRCPEGLDTAGVDELWYLNALHGITAVTQLNGSPMRVDEDRLTVWQHIAESWWRPV